MAEQKYYDAAMDALRQRDEAVALLRRARTALAEPTHHRRCSYGWETSAGGREACDCEAGVESATAQDRARAEIDTYLEGKAAVDAKRSSE